MIASRLASLMVAALLALSLCGCGRDADAPAPVDAAGRVAAVSDLVREAWLLQRQALAAVSAAPAPRAADVRLYWKLRNDIYDPARLAAATDTLLARWSAAPADPLWFELGVTRKSFLQPRAVVDSLRQAAAGTDTAAAAYHWVVGRLDLGRGDEAATHLRRAAALSEPGSMISVWSQLRLARAEQMAGEVGSAMVRMTQLLPEAQAAGGPLMAGTVWMDLSLVARRTGRLGDAQLAARAAEACAVAAGAGYPQMRARLYQGLVQIELGEYRAAFATFAACAAVSRDSVYNRGQKDAAGFMAQAARAVGDVESEHAGLADVLQVSTAAADSFGMIRACNALASFERRRGRWPAAEDWFARAVAIDSVWFGGDMGAEIARERAILLAQQGRYAEAQALFESASSGEEGDWYGQNTFEALMGLIRQGLETGRPDLVYPALAEARRLEPERMPRTPSYDPALQLDEVAARFHARQGEFHLADAALAHGRPRLEGLSPDARWYFGEAEALVAAAEEDTERARAGFARCESLAVALGNPDLIRRSRVQLGSALLQSGAYAAAESLFARDRDAPEFWNRVNANLLTGMSRTRAGRPRDALSALAAADSMLGEDAPRDLLARLRLEQGRALAGAGRPDEALAALAEAMACRGGPVPYDSLSDVGRSFSAFIDREIAEQRIALLWDRSGAGRSGKFADAARAAARAGRRPAPDLPEPATRERTRIEYFVGEDAAYLWVLPRGGGPSRWQRLESVARLAELVEAVAVDMAYPDREIDAAAAAELGRLLLAPALDVWPAGETLEILAEGPLSGLPWAALPLAATGHASTDEATTALERGPLVLVIDGLAVRPRAARGGGRLLVLGQDAAGSDETSGLAAAEAEARAVAGLWPGSVDLRVGGDAGWSDLRRDGASGYRAIHIASHTRIYEGADGQSCLYVSGREDEPPLTLPEVAALGADPELLYLSSCEGARRHRAAGRGVTSFADAFLAAGAGAVVASAIPVDDAAAGALAKAFYRHWLGGQTEAAALRLALLETRTAAGRHHPFYWAFVNVYVPGG